MTMTSALKRQANRRNALRSTGPRTPQGKGRSSGNALRHGLSAAHDTFFQDPVLGRLTHLIEQESIPAHHAKEIAARILAYEQNLDYQRELFQSVSPQAEPNLQQELLKLHGPELDILEDWLDWRRYEMGGVTKADLNKVAKMEQMLLRLTMRQVKRCGREQAQQAQRSIRYLKRAGSQLNKSLRLLKTV